MATKPKIRRLRMTTCGVPGYRFRAPLPVKITDAVEWSGGISSIWIEVEDVRALRTALSMGPSTRQVDTNDLFPAFRRTLAEAIGRLRRIDFVAASEQDAEFAAFACEWLVRLDGDKP